MKCNNKEIELYLKGKRDGKEELQQEIDRLNKIIDDIDKYIHYWNNKNIDEKTMLILNDILLIKNNMGKEVVRLQELKKEQKEIPQFEGTMKQLDELCDIKKEEGK